MALGRYALYVIGVGVLTWALAAIEIASPGGLQLHLVEGAGDTLGTSEYSPVEMLQPGILVICVLLYAWVAEQCPSQRPIAITFGGLGLAFAVRELDYFADRLIADNFWQVVIGVILALLITYVVRNRRRFRIAWHRMWPSPGMAIIFSGALIIFVFVQIIGHEPLWMALMGDHYERIVKLAVEEFIELSGYYLWLIGTIEYAFQARVIARREPVPAASKRRAARRPRSKGRY